ncbi:MAG: phage minor capsid protein [Anaerolineales bacterium]|nr:phage minor capsid protein [Anaerolineales bacterium]
MLNFDQLDILIAPLMELYERYQMSVIKDIARRLAKLKTTHMAAWQMQRLIEAGLIYEHALEELSKLTGKSERELRRVFQKAGVKSVKFDDVIYKAAGLKPTPLNLSPAMTQVLAAGLRKTGGVIRNLTMSTASSAQNAFIDAADLAYMQVSSGAFDYNTAIRNAVIEVANNGLSAIGYASGRRDQLDVAVRRTVLTGVSQTAGELTEARMDEMGTDLVQTSAHIGARNKGDVPENHELWQGRVFSRKGNPDYPNFYEVTGYGTVVGLYGVNCRHSHHAFYPGISEKLYNEAILQEYAGKIVTYNGQEMSWYEATQKQREIERKIREWKRREEALKAAGLDASEETAKVREWQAKMRDFTKQTGLYRQYERERISYTQDFAQEKNEFNKSVRELTDPKEVLPITNIQREAINAWSPKTTKTVLTGERRLHYLRNHPEIEEYEKDLWDLIHFPDEVYKDKRDKNLAIFYKLIDKDYVLRAVVWISNQEGLSNSIHSLRLASISEMLKGFKRGLRIWKK